MANSREQGTIGVEGRRRQAKSGLGRLGALLGLPLIVAMVFVALAPAVASAASIQIGTFSWDAIAEDEDEFLFFCDAMSPCSRFTVTNDLDDLTASELAAIGLPSSDAAFDDVQMPGVVPGSLGSLTAALGSFVWITQGDITLASVSFQLLNGLTGTLMFPTLTGPTGNPVPIFVETAPTPTPVPEPSSLVLLGSGLLMSTYQYRRLRTRVASACVTD